jgi:tetratricopeptide (TPR) repeat protein
VLRATTADGRAGYDFAHDIVRHTAYRQLSDPRRRLIHLRIARALHEQVQRGDIAAAGDVAHHAALAGDDELAARACIAAGERCLRLFAYAQATDLARRGRQHVAQLPQEVRLRLHIALLALYLQPDLEDAERASIYAEAQQVEKEAESIGLRGVVGESLWIRMQTRYWRGDLGGALRDTMRLEQAARVNDIESKLKNLGHVVACLAHLEQELERARQLAIEAEQLVTASGVEVLEVTWGVGSVKYVDGEHARAKELLTRAVELSRGSSNQWPAWDAATALARIELEDGAWAEALVRARDAVRYAEKMGAGSEPALSAVLVALARSGGGEPAAEPILEAALLELGRTDAQGFLAYGLAMAAEIDLRAGRLDAAERRAESAREAGGRAGRTSELVWSEALLAACALERGDRPAALAHFEAVRTACRSGASIRIKTLDKARALADRLGVTIEGGPSDASSDSRVQARKPDHR